MELERMFMTQFSIKKKPDNIFDLIEAAVCVAEVNYATQLNTCRHKLLKQLMNSGKYKDDQEEEKESSNKTTHTQDSKVKRLEECGEQQKMMNIKNRIGGSRKKETDMVDRNKQLKNGGDQKGTKHLSYNTHCNTKKSEAKQRSTGAIKVATPMQKTTETKDIKGLKKKEKMDFESSKRKFEEKSAEQKVAKRRIVTVDFHDMSKPAKDAPKRYWNRKQV